MAEELTPQKEDGNDKESNRPGGEAKRGGRRSSAIAEGAREDVLRELAKACKRQGNFHLACKKYTQVSSRSRSQVLYDLYCLAKPLRTTFPSSFLQRRFRRTDLFLCFRHADSVAFHILPHNRATERQHWSSSKGHEQRVICTSAGASTCLYFAT